jgi:hypothetical protein
VEEARSLENGQAGPVALRARKRELLQKILSRDEEIRILTQDWMHELREILDSASNTQRLNRAYSQNRPPGVDRPRAGTDIDAGPPVTAHCPDIPDGLVHGFHRSHLA